jgi:glycosyltransferase involved in cell wall biosynthesis
VVEDGVKIYRLSPHNFYFYPTGRCRNYLFRLLWHIVDIFNFVLAWKIKKILQAEKPDIVHTHNLMGTSLLTPLVIRKLNLKHVHTLHDVQLIEPSGIILAKEKSRELNWQRRVYVSLSEYLFGSPMVVICSSQAVLDLHKRLGFFENSIFQVLRNPAEIVELKEKNNDNALHFIFIGQMEEHKGIMMLVEAMAQMGRENPDWQWDLNVAGEGSLLSQVRDRVGNSSRIHILGRLNRQEIDLYLQKSNVLIVSSICYENTPTVIFEAMSNGLAILSSDAPGVGEMVGLHQNGLFFKAGDIKSLQEQVDWCFKYRAELKALGERSAQKIKDCELPIYTEKLLQIYGKKVE